MVAPWAGTDMERTKAVLVVMLASLAGSLLVGAAPAAPSEASPSATGLSTVIAVSKNGELALGTAGGRTVVRDVSKGRTVRRLGAAAPWYTDLSDTGRYVLYQKGAAIAVVDVKTGRTRSAVRTRSGARIKPAWKAQACGEDCYDSDRPTVRGALSGNGRYVVYCANLKVPIRGDLYIKDMRTKALKVMPNACPMSGEAWNPEKKSLPSQIDISETGRVIMIKVSHEPAQLRLVLDRRTVRDVHLPSGSMWFAQMPNDGSAVYYLEYTADGDSIGKRYDVPLGTVTDLATDDPGGLGTPGDYRTPDSMTRRGRYVSYSGSLGPNSATGLAQVGVFDRQTGTTTDLTPALEALGLPRLDPFVPPDGVQRTQQYDTLLSGDGRTLFFGNWNGWYTVHMPG
jgi:hypothetical protein